VPIDALANRTRSRVQGYGGRHGPRRFMLPTSVLLGTLSLRSAAFHAFEMYMHSALFGFSWCG